MLLDKGEYWLEMCDDDLITAKVLLDTQRFLPFAFYCHLTIEKSLKAVIAYQTNEIPPKIHDLLILSDISNIIGDLSETQYIFLNQMNQFPIETRYPQDREVTESYLDQTSCDEIYRNTEDFLCWIKQKLNK